ncbi:MAG: bifunctional demethylmenaquinone methyltransferase/2-methoxy-6-polyprenyl-1,4-benzoquinol methylase UbiE [Candidatus Margulisbacteria bacterium]|nr:bifunctional demethylmenaquinone methyltransferase/2-methoxy-6-polyprenyl-1,4-benzoquinol methylase UbiE [Candidatus Margulisiibacteriota bacterium]
MSLQKSPKIIGTMFDQIAPNYDLVNRLTSFGQDVRWRKKLAQFIPNKSGLNLLDLATGTGDILITLQNKFATGIGIDLSEGMLKAGQAKILKQKLTHKITLQQGDATALPLPNESTDIITIAFGIRNVDNVPKALSEMFRILTPNGRVLILEFSLPSNWFIRHGYLLYFRHILPLIGGLISGNKKAYSYLNQSVESFPYGEKFLALLKDAGFSNIQDHKLCFGVATIYQGDK